MSLESQIFDALKTLVSNRVYPDIATENAVLPYITYQQVGGRGVNFLDSATPSKKNARIQINVWGETRIQVADLSRLVEDTMRAATSLQTSVLGASVAMYEPVTKLRGTRQDFSVWSS